MFAKVQHLVLNILVSIACLFMKPSVRDFYNGQFVEQQIRGYKLYDWQRALLSRFSDKHTQQRVYFRNYFLL